MYLLNLSLAQFLAILGAVSALAVALYLFDRSRRRLVVSTLKFWSLAQRPAQTARRRRIQQPWSLVLQLAGMALLLLAIGQLRFGTPARAGYNHILILDTSAWMAARSGNRTLMDLARDQARRYLQTLPARDRVMLVRADALTTPVTAFELDRKKIEAALGAARPGSTALNLDQAFAFARRLHSPNGLSMGEIAFAGAGRVAESDPSASPPPRNLRVLPVPDAIENCGLRRIGLRRSATGSDLWEIYVSAHNFGSHPRNVTLSLDFTASGENDKAIVGTRRLTLPAGADAEASFEYRTRAAGILGVAITPPDAFPGDERAALELPGQPVLPVTVYSDQPDMLRPLFAASPHVQAVYRKPSEYKPGDQGLVVLDRFIPPERPTADSLWIDPPAYGSPVPVRTVVDNVPFGHWDTGHPAAAGLRAKDFKLERTTVFEAAPDDGRVAEVNAGPVIVTRGNKPKIVVMGFHPALSGMRYELSTPLLFANLLRWISPEIFRHWELTGGSVGTVKLVLDEDISASDVKVLQQDNSPVPFTMHDRTLHFFAGTPGVVRVMAGDSEYVYSLTLPQVGDARWEPPSYVHRGIPRIPATMGSAMELWPWLALAGMGLLLAEWMLFGRARHGSAAVRPVHRLRRRGRLAEVRR
ncbi:MAG TPA: VWA domain-containing protein [Bryobacteraceae bacterium]|nr:VWA domain-containing protein [Bryobacteraceae bacterium]